MVTTHPCSGRGIASKADLIRSKNILIFKDRDPIEPSNHIIIFFKIRRNII